MRNIFSYLLLTLKGIGMGAADVIPGVSGGTIAFLTGIYQELIDSIKSINIKAAKLLFSGKIKAFWKHINGWFLVSVLSGILISFFSLARLMTYLMANHPIELWAFFFGLIISSAIYILKEIKKWNFSNILSLTIGIGIGATICLLSPSETPNELWFIFLSGSIAICAMILPGISGSFILLLLGKYTYMMQAIADFDVTIIAIFAIGAAIGIVAFSHFLSWLLKKWYNIAICVLSGFMIGSLVKVWPWQETISEGISRPILPSTEIWQALLFALIGIIIVFLLEFLAKSFEKQNK